MIKRFCLILAITCVAVSASSIFAAVTLLPDPTSSTASSSFAGDIPAWGPQNLYDLDTTAADLDTMLPTGDDAGLDYAGDGLAPHVVVFNYDAPVSFNGVAYAQRAGNGTEGVDKVPSMDFWVSDTDPGPAALDLPILSDPPGASLTIDDPEDLRFVSYDLDTEMSGQYVVVRLNEGGTFNPGGKEMALLIPEPATAGAAVVGILALLGLGRRRRNRIY